MLDLFRKELIRKLNSYDMLTIVMAHANDPEGLDAHLACKELLQDIISDFDEHVNREKETDVENME